MPLAEVNTQLVSVIVLTYNSSDFVVETLESVKNQNYKILEVIIADDASKDDTIEICKNWLAENEDRFVNFKIISPEKNTGIPANCNRGVRASSGEFIKIIAGDDLLTSDCITANLDFMQKNPEAYIVVSEMEAFEDGTNPRRILEIKKPIGLENPTAESQNEFLIKAGYFGNAPAIFYKKIVFENLKFDESIPLLEDYPFAIIATGSGFRFWYFPRVTVLYRVRNNSTYFKGNKEIFSNFYKVKYDFDKKYRHPNISAIDRGYDKFIFNLKDKMSRAGRNIDSPANRILFETAMVINPYRAITFFRRKLGSKY